MRPSGMARRPQLDTPGSWHHVMNRGLSKRPLFEELSDARFFLARLARQVRLGRVEVHAYCIMTTHFHLLVRSPKGELSEAMRRVQNEHTRRFNRRRRRDGSLIRGRFTSKLVGSIRYRRTLVRYIDANPVRAGVIGPLGRYWLGSADAYVNRDGPKWLERSWVEESARTRVGSSCYTPDAYRSSFGVKSEEEAVELREFVDLRTKNAWEPDPTEDLIARAPDRVRAWMSRKANLADGHRLGSPLCSPRALRAALVEGEADGQAWYSDSDQVKDRGSDLALAGLLRDMCRLSWEEVATHAEDTLARVKRRVRLHRELVRADGGYAVRASEVGHAAIRRCLG